MVRAGMRSTMATASATSSGAIIQLGISGAVEWPAGECGIHAARHNGGDPHVILAMVEHHGLGESVETELGGVVAGAAAERVLARQAGDVDDESAAALRRNGPAPRASSRTVRSGSGRCCDASPRSVISATLRNTPSPALLTRMSRPPNSRSIAAKNLRTAATLADIGGIPGHAAERLHAGHGAVHRFLRAPADGHLAAFAQQALGDGASDAARAAGHGGDLSGERFHT